MKSGTTWVIPALRCCQDFADHTAPVGFVLLRIAAGITPPDSPARPRPATVAGSQNTIDNAGTLNNGLTVGNGVNNITNESGATINQTFSVTGTQNTIVNGGTLNNGVTVSGDGVNSITNTRTGVINPTSAGRALVRSTKRR